MRCLLLSIIVVLKLGLINCTSQSIIKMSFETHYVIDSLLCSIPFPNLIKEIHINDCDLIDIPKSLLGFNNLEILDLSRNRFGDFPDDLYLFKSIKELHLKDCEIQLKKNIDLNLFLKIEIIDLGSNNLAQSTGVSIVCDTIGVVNISNNQFDSIPVDFLDIKKIELLCIEDSTIHELYDELFTNTVFNTIILNTPNLKKLPSSLKSKSLAIEWYTFYNKDYTDKIKDEYQFLLIHNIASYNPFITRGLHNDR